MSNELTTVQATDLILNESAMNSLYRLAEMMASSAVTVPKHLQGNPSDCMAVAMQAANWGMNPFAVAQKTHLVSGNLGYEAQLVNAVISSSRAIQGRFHYEFDQWKNGNGLVRVGAVLAGENAVTWGEWLDTAKVGTKNSPLWKTAPKQQAAYLAVKYWARLFCPEVILGVYSADEFEEAPAKPEPKDITPPKPTSRAAELEQLMQVAPAEQAQPKQPAQAVHPDTTPIEENHDPMVVADIYSQLMEGASSIEDLEQFYDEGIGRLRELYKHWKAAGDMDKANLCGDLSRTLQAVMEEQKAKLLTEAGV